MASQYRSISPRLHVADLVASLGFYRDILGFELRATVPASGGAPSFAILGRDAIELQLGGPAATRAPLTPSTCTLCFDVTNARAIAAEVAVRGILLEWGPENYSYGRTEFAIRDPDRNLLIIGNAI